MECVCEYRLPQFNHPVARSGEKARAPFEGVLNPETMKTKVRIFHVSEKNNKFVVGAVEYHVAGAILESNIKGSMKLSRAGRVGQIIDFGEVKLASMKEEGTEWSRLVVAQ